MKYHLVPVRMALMQRLGKGKCCVPVIRIQISIAIMENIMEMPQKLKTQEPHDPATHYLLYIQQI